MQKSIWIHHPWNIGTPEEVANHVVRLGCDVAIIKTSDGHWPTKLYGETWYLIGIKRNVTRYVQAMQAKSIDVWGFHWGDPRYGTAQDESVGIRRAIDRHGFTNYNLNFESLYTGHNARMAELLSLLPPQVDYTASLCKFPSNYVPVNYRALMNFCVAIMPMVYFLWSIIGAGAEMKHSLDEYRGMMESFNVDLPLWPILPSYIHYDAKNKRTWIPKEAEMIDAVNVAHTQGVEGFSFFALDHVNDSRMASVFAWLAGFEPSAPIHWDDLSEPERWGLMRRSLIQPDQQFLTQSGHVIE